MIKLSILIPSTPDREQVLSELLSKINEQAFLQYEVTAKKYNCEYVRYRGLSSSVDVIILTDDRVMPLGEKRELLYKESNGLFSIQLDTDDSIADNAIELILEAIKENHEIPCITFREKCMMNGVYKSSNHSIKYSKWQDNFDGYDYVRCVFYKDVIRTDIAQSVPFPKIRWNEDEQWSMDIKPLLTDEIHIDEELYYYIYEPKDTHEQRYGFDKQ